MFQIYGYSSFLTSNNRCVKLIPRRKFHQISETYKLYSGADLKTSSRHLEYRQDCCPSPAIVTLRLRGLGPEGGDGGLPGGRPGVAAFAASALRRLRVPQQRHVHQPRVRRVENRSVVSPSRSGKQNRLIRIEPSRHLRLPLPLRADKST